MLPRQLLLTVLPLRLELGELIGLLAALVFQFLKGMVQAADFMAEGAKFAELIMMLAAQRAEIIAQLFYGMAQAFEFRFFGLGLCAIRCGRCGERRPHRQQESGRLRRGWSG